MKSKIKEAPIMEETENIVSPGEKPKKEEKTTKKRVKGKQSTRKIRSHTYQTKVSLYDNQKIYTLIEGLEILRKISYARFDPTVELHFNLNINPQKTEQQLRTVITLPHGTGKKRVILVFAPENQLPDVQKNEVLIGSDDTLEKINNGWLGFDMVVAHPSFMPKLARVSKKLGPRGLMPNPKAGTVGENVPEILNGLLAGKTEIRTQPDSTLLHASVGKLSFSNEQLKENITVLVRGVIAAKPPKVKEPFIKRCFMKTTMGPSIKIELTKMLGA